MKKLLLLISLSIGCLAASAQPTSFGGITPGQTTREELKNLVKNPSKIGIDSSSRSLELRQPDGEFVAVKFHNDVVFEVEVSLLSFLSPNQLRPALIEKYGRPRIKVGGIQTVTCRNKFGASFERFDGEEELKWPVKDGVQGAIQRLAGNCAEDILSSYMLRHVDTVKAVELAGLEQARKASEESRRKLGNAF